MPARRGYQSRGLNLRPVDSQKNVRNTLGGLSSTASFPVLANAVTNPDPTNNNDVSHGCTINTLWVSFDVCGIGGTGVLNTADIYIAKNPGANLTLPSPLLQSASDNKKFIFKTWRAMIMRNQDGNNPYHWEGWVKVPKRYRRMGINDQIVMAFECTSALTGHFNLQAIYKWYR